MQVLGQAQPGFGGVVSGIVSRSKDDARRLSQSSSTIFVAEELNSVYDKSFIEVIHFIIPSTGLNKSYFFDLVFVWYHPLPAIPLFCGGRACKVIKSSPHCGI